MELPIELHCEIASWDDKVWRLLRQTCRPLLAALPASGTLRRTPYQLHPAWTLTTSRPSLYSVRSGVHINWERRAEYLCGASLRETPIGRSYNMCISVRHREHQTTVTCEIFCDIRPADSEENASHCWDEIAGVTIILSRTNYRIHTYAAELGTAPGGDIHELLKAMFRQSV